MTIIDKPTFETMEYIERRDVVSHLRVDQLSPSKEPRLIGYAAKFRKPSEDLGGFTEVIDPRAFTRALDNDADVRCLHNHDANILLGRVSAGTLFLAEDKVGLRVECFPPPTEQARNVIEGIKRGDITGMSFAFAVHGDGERWEYGRNGETLRTLLDVDLFDVSSVVWPAYPDTSIAVRRLGQTTPVTRTQRAGQLIAQAQRCLRDGDNYGYDIAMREARNLLG